jgi:mono/diheme cytochrome c family protein
MLKKILLGIGALVGLIVLGVAGMIGYASYRVGKAHDLPLPSITRASSPEAVARGQHIFQTTCAACHTDPVTGKLTGQQMRDLPDALGTMHSANLTSDPEFGIGAWKDEELARMIIYGIDRNGKATPMIAFKGMSDDDVAAIIGFMRSGHPDFEPVKKHSPDSQPTALGKLVMAFVSGINDKPRAGPIPTPPLGPTPEYGAYAANVLYDCYFCHTAGFSGNKLNEPGLFGGNFEFDLSPKGINGKIYSSNLTAHPTAGIGSWTLDEFKRALREGVSRDGTVLLPPMPRYRLIDDVEIEAIFNYLKTLPVVDKPTMASTLPRQKVTPSATPEQLFTTLGCEYCHGADKEFAEKLKNAAGKAPEEIAQWIRSPESFKPGTQMPSYGPVLDEGQALELARWVLTTKVGVASTEAMP